MKPIVVRKDMLSFKLFKLVSFFSFFSMIEKRGSFGDDGEGYYS